MEEYLPVINDIINNNKIYFTNNIISPDLDEDWEFTVATLSRHERLSGEEFRIEETIFIWDSERNRMIVDRSNFLIFRTLRLSLLYLSGKGLTDPDPIVKFRLYHQCNLEISLLVLSNEITKGFKLKVDLLLGITTQGPLVCSVITDLFRPVRYYVELMIQHLFPPRESSKILRSPLSVISLNSQLIQRLPSLLMSHYFKLSQN